MSYPLAVDTRSLDYVSEVWTEDGVFDRGAADPHKHSGDFDGAYGKGNILNEVGSPQLQASREAGLAHIMTAPHITIDGDEAAATNYTVLVVGKGDDCRVRRPSANRWDLVRVDGSVAHQAAYAAADRRLERLAGIVPQGVRGAITAAIAAARGTSSAPGCGRCSAPRARP